LQVSVDKSNYKGDIEELKEAIRKNTKEQLAEIKINFEPMDLVEKIMSQGAMTPVEIKVATRQLKDAGAYAKKIEEEMKKVSFLRDVRVAEPISYPSLKIDVNRELTAQFGLSMKDVSKVLNLASSSTRFTDKNMWIDPKSGLVFQVQVQFPESEMQSIEKLLSLPLKTGSPRPILADVATIKEVDIPAQVNRQGPNRYVTILANTYNKDLGSASKAVDIAIKNAGEAPKGTIVKIEGTLTLLKETMSSLQSGLLIAIVVIFLLMAAYYQSFAISGLLLSVVPAVAGGSLLFLVAFGSTLNLQSYMGIIMSIGVSVSNAVLMVNQAEFYRREFNLSSQQAAKWAASSRLRPILMTTIAMIAGMIPIASGMGEGGEQVAPLGQAVIGGLIFSSITTLLVLPNLFTWVRKNAKNTSPSLDPDDSNTVFSLSESKY
jgi:multidrug efflux pump subunit AcrB